MPLHRPTLIPRHGGPVNDGRGNGLAPQGSHEHDIGTGLHSAAIEHHCASGKVAPKLKLVPLELEAELRAQVAVHGNSQALARTWPTTTRIDRGRQANSPTRRTPEFRGALQHSLAGRFRGQGSRYQHTPCASPLGLGPRPHRAASVCNCARSCPAGSRGHEILCPTDGPEGPARKLCSAVAPPFKWVRRGCLSQDQGKNMVDPIASKEGLRSTAKCVRRGCMSRAQGKNEIASTEGLLSTAWPAMAPSEVPMACAPMLALVAHTPKWTEKGGERQKRGAASSIAQGSRATLLASFVNRHARAGHGHPLRHDTMGRHCLHEGTGCV